MSRIQVLNLSKEYGEHRVRALSDASLNIEAGEFVALMGPSGCGKSTLLNLMGGIDWPSAGQILLEDRDLSQLDDAALTEIRRDRVGFVFQFFNLLSTLTVSENVALPLQLRKANRLSESEIRRRVLNLLEEFGVGHRVDFFPAQLSGGEIQRVAIARALVHEPSIILADEPTGNLDTENGEVILKLLRSLANDKGQTIVMATHSEEAAGFAHRTIRMRDGKILTPAGLSSGGNLGG